jgi:hypothetical protein
MWYLYIPKQEETAKNPTASSMSAFFQCVAISHVKAMFST